MRKIKILPAIIFLIGVVVGGVVGFLLAFLPYYHHYWVELGGPAGAIANSFHNSTNDIQDPIKHRARSPAEIVSNRVVIAGANSLLAAGAYCSMNDGDKALVRMTAVSLASDEYMRIYIKDPGKRSVRDALDYLMNAGGPERCVPFHPDVGS